MKRRPLRAKISSAWCGAPALIGGLNCAPTFADRARENPSPPSYLPDPAKNVVASYAPVAPIPPLHPTVPLGQATPVTMALWVTLALALKARSNTDGAPSLLHSPLLSVCSKSLCVLVWTPSLLRICVKWIHLLRLHPRIWEWGKSWCMRCLRALLDLLRLCWDDLRWLRWLHPLPTPLVAPNTLLVWISFSFSCFFLLVLVRALPCFLLLVF